MLSIVAQWKPCKCERCARPPWALRTATRECEMGEMMKNESNRIRGIASNPTISNQIQPNPTKKNGPARIKARAVGSKLARTSLDLGRARWIRGSCDWMNGKVKGLSDCNTTPGQGTRPTMRGQAKDLSDCNTCFIYDEGERESGLEGNLRLNSLKFAYVRVMGKNVAGRRMISRAAAFGSKTGLEADRKIRGLTRPRTPKRGFIASKAGEAWRVEGTEGCIKLAILSPRGTSGERTEERGNQ